MSAATLSELKDVLRLTLEDSGYLAKLRASVRAEVFSCLDDNDGKPTAAEVPLENVLINELFREYLEWNNFKNTLSVLCVETNLSTRKLPRNMFLPR